MSGQLSLLKSHYRSRSLQKRRQVALGRAQGRRRVADRWALAADTGAGGKSGRRLPVVQERFICVGGRLGSHHSAASLLAPVSELH